MIGSSPRIHLTVTPSYPSAPPSRLPSIRNNFRSLLRCSFHLLQEIISAEDEDWANLDFLKDDLEDDSDEEKEEKKEEDTIISRDDFLEHN